MSLTHCLLLLLFATALAAAAPFAQADDHHIMTQLADGKQPLGDTPPLPRIDPPIHQSAEPSFTTQLQATSGFGRVADQLADKKRSEGETLPSPRLNPPFHPLSSRPKHPPPPSYGPPVDAAVVADQLADEKRSGGQTPPSPQGSQPERPLGNPL